MYEIAKSIHRQKGTLVMQDPTRSQPVLEAFSSSRGQFEAMVGRMISVETAAMPHGDLEELLQREGQELLRRLLQDHLDLRTAREHRVAVVGREGLVSRGSSLMRGSPAAQIGN